MFDNRSNSEKLKDQATREGLKILLEKDNTQELEDALDTESSDGENERLAKSSAAKSYECDVVDQEEIIKKIKKIYSSGKKDSAVLCIVHKPPVHAAPIPGNKRDRKFIHKQVMRIVRIGEQLRELKPNLMMKKQFLAA